MTRTAEGHLYTEVALTLHVSLNSQTAGKFRRENIDGREHIVTEMVPIVGDTVMNGGLYPDAEVAASYTQLNNLPAPNGHPVIGGKSVSAFHPVATNAHNTGGFIRSPRRDGCRVICEFWLDVEVANRTDDGKELMRRIENGEKVGVSTGLTLNQRIENGQGADGKAYKWVGSNFQFDHVAVLLNERAAGEHVGTELVVNGEKVQIVKVDNELSAWEIREKIDTMLGRDGFFVFVVDFFPESQVVVYEETPRGGGEPRTYRRSYDIGENDEITLGSITEEVARKVTFEPVKEESSQMANKDDNDKGTGEISVENAKSCLEAQGYTVLNSADGESYEAYVANKQAFEDWQKVQAENLDALRKSVMENTGLSESAVAKMDESELITLNAAFDASDDDEDDVEGAENGGPGKTPKINNAPRVGGVPGVTRTNSAPQPVNFLEPPAKKEA